MIKIGKHRWIKVHRCKRCGKWLLTVSHPLSRHCKRCHTSIHRSEKRKRRKIRLGSEKNANRRFVEKVGYCQLCGSTENLTCHHVGGGCNHKTCLCDNCHQAYERWAMKNKLKIWRINER